MSSLCTCGWSMAGWQAQGRWVLHMPLGIARAAGSVCPLPRCGCRCAWYASGFSCAGMQGLTKGTLMLEVCLRGIGQQELRCWCYVMQVY